jgi:hypothetical protein
VISGDEAARCDRQFREAIEHPPCPNPPAWSAHLTPRASRFFAAGVDRKSNLAGHQTALGILHDFPGLMAITFLLAR